MTTLIQPGLLTLHSHRAERLADTVLAWLAGNPLAPLEEEVILVQSNGMAEWLKMTLAQRAGVCAATRVELPGRFMWRTYRQVLGTDAVSAHIPLDKTGLTWRLMRLLPMLLGEPGFEPIAGFLRPNEPDRLYQLAARLADLFDQYQVYRADWLDDWEQGRDHLRVPGRPDLALPADQRWQPALWRTLTQELDEHERACIRPRLHGRVVAALEQGQPLSRPVARRVVLFGMTHVPLATMELLAALSGHSQVMLAVPNPCRYHWADIMDGRELLRSAWRRLPLRGEVDLSAVPLESMHAHAHPLLAAWGRQGRDFVRQLDAFEEERQARQMSLPRIDLFDEEDADQPTLLEQVQQRVRDLVPLAEHPDVRVPAGDRSIVFHVAHSAQREVEVLHDQLLQLFADSAAEGRPVQPRDVVVMVPDVEVTAPAIRAVFGQHSRHDPRYIPFDIADLSTRASSPLVAALEWLLRLPQQRSRLSELRDLIDVPAVARRFGIDPEAHPRLAQWMSGSGIRWGLHAGQREALDLAACGEQNTAWFGLRRMLLGYASGAGRLAGSVGQDDAAVFAGIEPYDEVGGLEAELAGALAALLDALLAWWAEARQDASPAVWADRARALLAAVFAAADEADRHTLTALEEALSTWQTACDEAGFADAVSLDVMREAWLAALDAPALNKRFRAGGVTFCTLMPMRAIPFKVVCLLGMNDGDYPRRAPRSDFDLMGLPGQVRPGDRSRRDDDRQLMLEAVLSARRMLYVSWTGRSVRDNTEQPPSVLVSQLRDYLTAGWLAEDEADPVTRRALLRDRTTEHPLQPFSRRYFEADSLLFTHAREWRAAHDAPLAMDEVPGTDGPGDAPLSDEAEATSPIPSMATAIPPLPPFEPDPHVPLTLAQLTSFVRRPVGTFFRQRLNVVFDELADLGEDEETFALDGLENHQLADALLKDVVVEVGAGRGEAGATLLAARVDAQIARIQRAGRLPMGGLGERQASALRDQVLPALTAWYTLRKAWAQPAPRQRVQIEHRGMLFADWLDQLHHLGDEPEAGADLGALPPQEPVERAWLALDPGRLMEDLDEGPPRIKKLLGAWVRSLAAAACGLRVGGRIVGSDATLHIHPMQPEQADADLAALIDLWRDGLSAPLPAALETGLAQVSDNGKPQEAYEGAKFRRGEVEQDPCLARLFPDYDTLCGHPRYDEVCETLYRRLADWASDHVAWRAHPEPIGHTPAAHPHSEDASA
ncbi:exodeoxyribonuclease V subunit gamma [Aquabacterium olei]|uniref:RecBCD enzyme subunit RecC n=1 Tax=Aquabacterium olei TaxID=1296669 RepID=A0A2U8FP35_9BURK|nr:exodeoxyribonuclease V subunit gamma [Aquabacterium olei]AWI52773.1 exodeoxyribonuclease V subunit gamma [Aquabacterium olei]